MDRKIIIALIIIAIIVLVGLISFSSAIKTDTQIDFLTGSSLKNGDQIQFELKDAQGNALSNQKIIITFGSKYGKQNFTITTDDQGKGRLILQNETSGNYSISVNYEGDIKHNGCTANKNITIKDENSESSNNSDYETSTQSTSDSSYSYTSDSSSNSESNEGSDSNGVIESGQNKGVDSEYLKTHQQRVVDGNLE